MEVRTRIESTCSKAQIDLCVADEQQSECHQRRRRRKRKLGTLKTDLWPQEASQMIDDEMSPTQQDTIRGRVSSSSSEIEMKCSQDTRTLSKSRGRRRRKSRKRSQMKLATSNSWPIKCQFSKQSPKLLLGASYLLLTILQLICDNGRLAQEVAIGNSESSNSQASTAAVILADSSFGRDTQAAKTPFLIEPQDIFAVAGQTDRQLNCVIVQPAKPFELSWNLGQFLLSRGLNLIAGTGSFYSVSMEPINRLELLALERLQAAASSAETIAAFQQQSFDSHQAATGGPIGIKYTLHIKNVTLGNTEVFSCILSSDGRYWKSRQALVSKLAPPSRLDIRAFGEATELAEQANQLHHQDSIQQQSGFELAQDQTIPTIEVKQNAMLKLECQSNQAKPRAELVWLNEDQEEVAPRALNGDENGVSSDSLSSEVEQFAKVDETNVGLGLEISGLVWSFRVRREHHNKVFTCLARHKAFELSDQALGYDNSSSDSARPEQRLARSIRLSVLYPPEVELSRDPLQAHEFAPIRFFCNAHARPNQMRFSWFVDEQLVEGAQQPELFISSLTRQLHLREIRCQVENSVGRTSANVTRLGVKYSPAYVTPLLPSSLQPDSHLADSVVQVGPNDQQLSMRSNNEDNSNNFERLFRQLDPRISAELAIGAAPDSEATLRCDFDSNPPLSQVHWFKINTEFSSMRDVTPREADELIAFGANHAIFKTASTQSEQPNSDLDSTTSVPITSSNTKRHISIEHQQTGGGQSADLSIWRDEDGITSTDQTDNWTLASNSVWRHELDFERMSAELLIEMKVLELQQKHLLERPKNQTNEPSGGVDAAKLIEPLSSELILPLSQTVVTIDEPLELQMLTRRRRRLPIKSSQRSSKLNSVNNNNRLSDDETTSLETMGATTNELVLIGGAGSTRLQPIMMRNKIGTTTKSRRRLNGRQAQLTSSSLQLKRTNADSIGRYVCMARSPGGLNSTAKSVFFVLKQRPRIISADQQWAPLGARQVQVECLVQINTVRDNQTQVTWHKDDKLIDVMHKFAGQSQANKNVSIIEELSPDALFIRSTLRINGAEFSDFGTYTCTVVNSLNKPDMLHIKLNPSAPTGVAFQLMASLTIVSIVLFLTIVCLIFAIDPCKRFDKSILVYKSKCAKQSESLDQNAKKCVSGSMGGAQMGASTRHNQREFRESDNNLPFDFQAKRIESVRQQNGSAAMQNAANLSLDNSRRYTNQAAIIQRPGSAFSANHLSAIASNTLNSSFRHHLNNHQQQLARTCSFRGPRRNLNEHQSEVGSSQLTAQLISAPNRFAGNNKFAAIHESLEHKLQFDSSDNTCQLSQAAFQQLPLGSTSTCSTSACNCENEEAPIEGIQLQPGNGNEADDSDSVFKQNTDTKLSKRLGLLERIRSTFNQSGRGKARSSVRSGKRPVISEPVRNQDNSKQQQQRPNKQLVNMMQLNQLESQLVSSSANLIQDSTTASCETTSTSGRSSSTSNLHLNQNSRQVSPRGPPMINSARFYANNLGTPIEAANNHSSNQQATTIYANEHFQFPTATNNPADFEACQQQQQQVIANDHYQMPMLMSEPYLAAAVAQVVAQQQHQQQHLIQEDYYTDTAAYPNICNFNEGANVSNKLQSSTDTGYGTIMAQQQLQQHRPVLVQTSDAGEAYFESNYGTLLSRSAATYKTLGYTTSHHLNSANDSSNAGSTSSSGSSSSNTGSSSPANSLTTHANVRLANFHNQFELQTNDSNDLSSTAQQERNQLQQQRHFSSGQPDEGSTPSMTDGPNDLSATLSKQTDCSAANKSQQHVISADVMRLNSLQSDLATHV